MKKEIKNSSLTKLCPNSVLTGCFILLLWLFISCETQTVWDLQSEEVPIIIVDGIVTNEIKVHEIKITMPVTALNVAPEGVMGATVAIYDGDSIHYLTESTEIDGIYLTDSLFGAVVDKKYTLYINYNNREYTAHSGMLPVFLFDTLKYSFNTDTGMYQVNYITEQYQADAAMYQIDLDWTQVPGFDSILPEKKRARFYAYSLPSIDVSELFSPDKERIYFPAGTQITETKYALTVQHAEFIRTLLAETEWRGGFFDVSPGNITTNLSQGARGYFGVCSVAKISFKVK